MNLLPSLPWTAGALAVVTSVLQSTISLMTGIAASTLVVCAGILATRASRRTETSAPPEPAVEPVPAPATEEADFSWTRRVLAFAVDLRGSLSAERLHEVIADTLPALAGVDEMWIETAIGQRRHPIRARREGDAVPVDPLWKQPGEWATFPLQAGDSIVGVLGVPITQKPLSTIARRTLEAVAPLIGESLHTAQTIAHLRELSTVDSVTGCATRQEGLDRLRSELKRAQRSSQEVAIMMLDLDYFKSINDRYGHQCGDSVLGAIGRTIMQTLRVSDVRCRWGGEEFLVALPESGLEQAKRAAVALARRIAATVTEYDSARIQLTASIGITIASPGEEDLEPVLARADAALYRAKTDGRNCIRIMLPGPLTVETPSVPASTPASAVASGAVTPFRERRDPHRTDRRQHPGPGRRATDFGNAGRQSPADPSNTDGSLERANEA